MRESNAPMDDALYEVEQKFPVDDFRSLLAQFKQRAIVIGDPVEQHDRYYAHPARNFSVTDEALRIRQVGRQSWMTYKGPRVDTGSKTRREIEIELPSGASTVEEFDQLLLLVGFKHAGSVVKKRRAGRISLPGWDVSVMLDEVVSLGCFVELETIVREERLEDAECMINQLAGEFDLFQAQQASYLELVLAKG